MKRHVIEATAPDHMHWYRVIGAVYLRERRALQLDRLAEFATKLDTGHDMLGRTLEDM